MDILYHELWSDVLIEDDGFVQVSPSSFWVASGGYHRTLRLYRAWTGEKVLSIRLSASLSSLSAIAFPSEGFICGHENGALTTIHMMGLDIDENYTVHSWAGSNGPIVCCTASERYPLFASVSQEDICLWAFNVNEGRFMLHGRQAGISNVWDIKFIDTLGSLLITHSSGEITCLALQNLEILWTVKLPFEINRFSLVYDTTLFFTTRDNCFMQIPLPHKHQTVSLTDARQIGRVSNVLGGIAMTYDGQLIYVDQSRNTVVRMYMNCAPRQLIKFHPSAGILSYSVSQQPSNVRSFIAVISRHPSQNGRQIRVFGRENALPSHETIQSSPNHRNLFNDYYGIRHVAEWMGVEYWVNVNAFNLVVALLCVGLIFRCLHLPQAPQTHLTKLWLKTYILDPIEAFLPQYHRNQDIL